MFAVLLPLTSRGYANQELFREQLDRFASSCLDASRCSVFVGIDDDDKILTEISKHEWMRIFGGCSVTVQSFVASKPAPISRIAASLAMTAYNSNSKLEYFVLLGDDVEIQAESDLEGASWMDCVVKGFQKIADQLEVRHGFGCVALPDATFPGFPTFPVISRVHLDIFQGRLWPSIFVNQDGDPFIWEIYRRWGASIFASGIRLLNKIGGDYEPRYDPIHVEWKGKVLQTAVDHVGDWLLEHHEHVPEHRRLVIMDVIVPTFRGTEEILRKIIDLDVPAWCSTTFIIIIDDPKYSELRNNLEKSYGARVRVRVNEHNMGASYSRNRGLDESAADWVLFLDDDVIPSHDILSCYAHAIRERGDMACGFVGPTKLPDPQTMQSTAVKMSYLTYFWDICVAECNDGANKYAAMPWGVTANLLMRRTKVRFDLAFPKTGGGEDIDFCLKTREELSLPLLAAHDAVANHPWWNNGYPPFSRFYGWASGDSLLLDMYPSFRYRSWPNIWETTVILLLLLLFSVVIAREYSISILLMICIAWNTEVWVDILHLVVVDPNVASAQTRTIRYRILCAALSSFYKNAAELGHLIKPFLRGSFTSCFARFDWWCGLKPEKIEENRARERTRFFLILGTTLPLLVSWNSYWPLISFLLVLYFRVKLDMPIAKKGAVSLEFIDCTKPNVVFVADEKYAFPLAAAISSLQNFHPDCVVYLVDLGISSATFEKLSQIANLHRITISLSDLEDLPTPAGIYGKTQLAKWLPKSVGKILYLDSDIIINGDISGLWRKREELSSEKPVAAVVDFGFPCGHDQLPRHEWTKDKGYFNCGVLLLDLAAFRAKEVQERIDVMLQNANTQPFRFKDQDILNIAVPGWIPLERKYNVQGLGSYLRPDGVNNVFDRSEWERLVANPVIVHFTGDNCIRLSSLLHANYYTPAIKPWNSPLLIRPHPYYSKFWKIARNTNFPLPRVDILEQLANGLKADISDLKSILQNYHIDSRSLVQIIKDTL